MDDLLERLARFGKSAFPRFEPMSRVVDTAAAARADIDVRAWSALALPA